MKEYPKCHTHFGLILVVTVLEKTNLIKEVLVLGCVTVCTVAAVERVV